jgi:excisionase family DNA binding protein
MTTQDELLTVLEFSQRLKISVAATRRWLLERRISSIRVGRLVRIRTSEAERMMRLIPARVKAVEARNERD